MSENYYRLNIDISNALRVDFDFNKLLEESQFANASSGMWGYSKNQLLDVFNHQWLDYMSSIGVPLSGAVLFYRKPYHINKYAHIDIRKDHGDSIYAINWLLDPEDDSEMVWFNTPKTPGEDGVTKIGSVYKSWPMAEVKDLEISRCCIKNIPTLVRVDIPHNVIVNSRLRWAISVRCPVEDNIKTWDDAVEKHKGLINGSV